MIKIDRDSFVVFDLDDTLYKEADYQVSGLWAVARFVSETYGKEVGTQLLDWRETGNEDLWGRLCEEIGLPASVKESLLWIYRLHAPRLELEADVRFTMDTIAGRACGVAILTDGRSVTQRLKLKALGLNTYPFYISEEWQSEKPDPKRFIAIQKAYDAHRYFYIADNPEKDFIAPNRLGWTTIGLRGDRRNVHPQDSNELHPDCHPSIWLDDMKTLLEFLC